MAVKIRLKRIGRRNQPFYRVCVFDGRTRRDGEPIEELGSYDPHATTFETKVTLKAERAAYWLSVGAQPSETVASLLRRAGVTRDGVKAPAAAPAAETAAATATAATAAVAPAADAPATDAPAAEPPANEEGSPAS